jgi:hypothetical protein
MTAPRELAEAVARLDDMLHGNTRYDDGSPAVTVKVSDLRLVLAALAEAQRERDHAERTLLSMASVHNRLAAAQGEAAKLREALARAQWQVNGTCVVCRQPIHTEDCVVGAALAAPPSTAAMSETDLLLKIRASTAATPEGK